MTEEYKTNAWKIGIAVAVLLGVFLIVESVYTYKQYVSLQGNTTITVTGAGKVEKAPDTARVSFSIEDTQKTLSVAQDNVSKKIDAVTAAVVALGIPKDAVSTDSYGSYPEYTYPQNICTANGCTNPSPILKGYHVSHMVTIKISDITKTDNVLGALGTAGVTNITGPNLGFADDKVVAREARDMAIKDAQAEAEKLAKALGVRLVRVVSFNENNGGGMPVPMYNERALSAMAPQAKDISLPVGSQKVESTVSITYEIR